MIFAYSATDVGPKRAVNEDAVAVLDCNTYVVADGMGGYAAGEVASRILVDTVKSYLEHQEVFGEETLREAIRKGNDAIMDSVRENPAYAGMGTTATMFHIEGTEAVWAHVGDSRLYLLRNGRLSQITRDHSLVSDLVANGSITPEEAREHPKRNVITRAVGVSEEIIIDTGAFTIKSGDILLLSTDGLTSVLSDDEICGLIMNTPKETDMATLLVQKAIEAGSRDNISAVAVIFDA